MFNHLFLIFFILFISTVISAQLPEVDSMEKETRKMSIGIIGSIDYCNRTLHNKDGGELYNSLIQVRNKGEIAKPGYTIGFALHIPVGASSNLRTGLSYSNKGFQHPWNRNLQWSGQPPPGFTGIKFVNNDYYLDIPLTFEVYLDREKQRWFVNTGITTNIFLKETSTQIVEENGEKRRSTHENEFDFNSINLSPEISIGRKFQVSENVAIRIAPVFRYGILRIFNAPITEYLWSAGLNMSCIFGS